MFKALETASRGDAKMRFLDRYCGIPLVLALSLFRKRNRSVPQKILRVGVLATAAIGDTILLSPVLKDLKKYLGCEIELFVGDSNAEIAELLKCSDRHTVLPVKNPFRAIPKIRERQFDLWIDTGQWPRINSVYSYFAKARYKVGFKTPGQYRHFVFDKAVLHSNQVHEIDNFRNLVGWLGVKSTAIPQIELDVKKVKDRVVLHLFAGGSKPYQKEWPDVYWVKFIDFLTKQGKKVFLTGTAANLPQAEKIKTTVIDNQSVEIVAGKLSLEETANLLKSAEKVISVNTGVLHLAAALGVDLIGINGPTSSKRWGPLGSHSKSLNSDLSCSPCLNLGFDFGCPKNLCMQAIKPEQLEEIYSSLVSVAVDKTAQQSEH